MDYPHTNNIKAYSSICCVSHASIVSKQFNGLSWFWHKGLYVLQGNLVSKKTKGISLWNLVPNSDVSWFFYFLAMD